MPQFYPDGPAAVNLNAIQENGGINVPAEPAGEFDTPGMQGSMQQLLSENLGKFVMADFLIGVSSIVRRVGILYSVGRGFVVIYDENYHTFQVCDIFSLKFVAFFPPGFEPSLEDLVSGEYSSGILNPGYLSGILRPEGAQTIQPSDMRATGRGLSGNATSPSSMGPTIPNSNMNGSSMNGSNSSNRNSTIGGCRTLGQR